MGILSDKELAFLNEQKREMAQFGSGINYSISLSKDNKSVWIDIGTKMCYFLEDAQFEKCYKKMTVQELRDKLPEYLADGWVQ